MLPNKLTYIGCLWYRLFCSAQVPSRLLWQLFKTIAQLSWSLPIRTLFSQQLCNRRQEMVQARLSVAPNLSLHTTSSWEGWITMTNLGSTVVSGWRGERAPYCFNGKGLSNWLGKGTDRGVLQLQKKILWRSLPTKWSSETPLLLLLPPSQGKTEAWNCMVLQHLPNVFVPQWKRSGGLFSHASP